MKNLISTSLFSLILLFNYGQSTFEKTFGGEYDEYAHSILQTEDNGYILCGHTCTFGSGGQDVYIVKTDASGTIEWTQTYGGGGEDHGYYISKANNGGFIICAESTSTGSRTAYIIRIDSNGNVIWENNINANYLSTSRCLVQTEANDIIVCGSTSMTNLGETDVLLFKLNESGELIWNKKYGGDGYDFAYSICETTDGGFVMAGGSSFPEKGNYDIYIIKTDTEGDTVWTRKYGGSIYDAAYSILKSNDGNLFVGSSSAITGDMKHRILKLDNNGDTLWTKTYGEDASSFGMNISLTNDNCLIGCGWSKNLNEQESRLNLYKTDVNGNLLWFKYFGGDSYDIGYDVFEANDLGLVVAGYTQSFGAGMADMYLIKTDSEGFLTSMNEFNKEKNLISIFPNPATSFITIQLKEDIPIEETIIYNHLGQKALVSKPVNNSVDVSKLKRGIYFLEVITSQNRIRTKLVIE
jgi:hypothetical protein